MKYAPRQLIGAILLIIAVNALSVYRLLNTGTDAPRIPFTSPGGTNIVEISGDPENDGIYFVPPGTEIKGLFAGINPDQAMSSAVSDAPVVNGSKLTVQGGSGQVRVEKIPNSQKFVLDMKMDLNSVDFNDLILIPGLGEKTAEAILEMRNSIRRFSSVEQLMQVRGIGKKKCEKFGSYLTIGS